MYTIIARRWFEKTNGNTYHSCEVYQDGKLIERVPFAYGYEEQYRQTAHEILVRAGLFSGDYHDFLMVIRDYDNWLFSVTDVTRKKDL